MNGPVSVHVARQQSASRAHRRAAVSPAFAPRQPRQPPRPGIALPFCCWETLEDRPSQCDLRCADQRSRARSPMRGRIIQLAGRVTSENLVQSSRNAPSSANRSNRRRALEKGTNKPDQYVECSYCYYGSCEQHEDARCHVDVFAYGVLWSTHVGQNRRSVPAFAACKSRTEQAENHQAERGGFRPTQCAREQPKSR